MSRECNAPQQGFDAAEARPARDRDRDSNECATKTRTTEWASRSASCLVKSAFEARPGKTTEPPDIDLTHT